MAAAVISDIRRRYSSAADFCYVYVSEAHASDEWPLGGVESHPQPSTLEERRGLACRFQSRYASVGDATAGVPDEASSAACGTPCEPMPILVDGMDDAFAEAFAVWPERFFVIEDRRVSYISQPCNELGFDRSEIAAHLERIAQLGPTFSRWFAEEGPSTGEDVAACSPDATISGSTPEVWSDAR